MSLISKYIIYGLIDPFTKELRYIGKSVSGLYRPTYHSKPYSYNGQLKNTYLYRWIRKLIKNNSKPEIVVLDSCSNKQDLAELEVWNISYWKGLGCRLTNATKGGEGAAGRIVSKATRNKIRKANLGKKASKETIKKLRESHLGQVGSMKGKTHSEATKLKISQKQASKRKPIICLETGEIFSCSRDVVDKMNVQRGPLLKHLKKRKYYNTVKGHTFEYLNKEK